MESGLEEPATGTRWGRTLAVLLPALMCAGGLGGAMATGALATSVTVQSGNATLATSSLFGTDFGLAVVPETYQPAGGGAAATRNVMRLAFANGKINGLCISEPESFAGVGYTLMFKVAEPDASQWNISAENIVLDLTNATGTLDLDGVVGAGYSDPEVQIGADGASISVANVGALGSQPGWWGIKAGIAKFGPVTAVVQSMRIQGLLTMPNLSITVQAAGTQCPAAPAPTGTPPQ